MQKFFEIVPSGTSFDFVSNRKRFLMISLFVALTLTPMLAARMPPPKERAHGSIYHRLERGFGHLDGQV